MPGDDDRRGEARSLAARGVRHVRAFEEIAQRHLQELADSGRIDLRRTGRADFSPPEPAGSELRAARECYLEALRVIPKDATADLAIIHHQLGGIYKQLGVPVNAEHHLGEAIRLHEAVGDRFHAGQSRHDLAQTLIHHGKRYRTARMPAAEALADFTACGSGAGREAQRIRDLLTEIDGHLAGRE